MKYAPLAVSLCCLSSLPAIASIDFDTPQGNLKLYGDVEFNVDVASKKRQLTSTKTQAVKDFDASDINRWDVNGRILIGLDGRRDLDQYYAGFTVQPLADLSGKMNLDDAAFFFGEEANWQLKLGRFEAYDMFPLGQDTFIEYSGNTANDIYDDGFGYIYMMKEARGRSSDGGSIQLIKELGEVKFELNTMIKDGTTLFYDDNYHGYKLKNDKNVVYLRPVVSWRNDDIAIAAAAETNVVKDAYGYYDSNGKWQDQSKRNGYGLTMSWNSENNWSKANEGMLVNVSVAYMDADQETDFTAGTNINWQGFSIGYIFANNNIKHYNTAATDPLDLIGKYRIHTVNASYLIPNVMGMDNFNIYLGTYWSKLERDESQGDGNENRYGARVRFKYFF
ncbi:raffinose porin [Orbus hercynius]|uniref:Raffinose porin n=1 Tax=Orbus hercynius TaxID=593135 RepID=A0A495RJB3_9GAMM|nr:carbohydrate porin [Orbus hercynius]RKS87632.1 raffinose porin [Orbus hercynius]